MIPCSKPAPAAVDAAVLLPAVHLLRPAGGGADQNSDEEELAISPVRGGCKKNLAVNAAKKAASLVYDPHSRLLAMAAPSLSARSFAQTMLSVTFGSLSTAVPKPQSTPAMSRSRSMIPA